MGRVTADMRRVNKVIKKTNLPLPRVEDIKAQLSDGKVFVKLDMGSAFHQLTLEEESRFATVFHTNGRLMCYKNLNKAIWSKVKACLPCQAHTMYLFLPNSVWKLGYFCLKLNTPEPQALLQLPRPAWDKV